jgi:hypothetical protein
MRKFILPILPLLAATLVVTACQTDSFNHDFKHLRLGMDKSDVVETVGTAQREERKDGREWWYYTAYEDREKVERMVVFDNGKVIYAGHLAVPHYVKDARLIDRKNEQSNKAIESQFEHDRVNAIPTQDLPPTPAEPDIPPPNN